MFACGGLLQDDRCLGSSYTSPWKSCTPLKFSPRTLFVSTRLQIWNSCVKLIIKGENIFDTNIASFKFKVKKSLLEIQNAFDENEWYPDLNFDINTLTKLTNTAILKVDQSNWFNYLSLYISPYYFILWMKYHHRPPQVFKNILLWTFNSLHFVRVS